MASEKLLCRSLTILTGLPRSGTTWSGKMIGSHPEVNYIFEPFSKRYHPELPDSDTCYRLAANYLCGDKALNDALYFNEAVYSEIEQYEEAFIRQLNGLILHYFPDSKNKHLILKTPKISKIQWLAKVLKPDHIIYIDRHLGAVVNSYIRVKRGLLNWSENEFQFLSNSIGKTHPQFQEFVNYPKNRVERATVVLGLNRTIGLDFLRSDSQPFKFQYITFEQTCLSIENTLQEVFDFLGLEYDADIHKKIDESVNSSWNKVKHLQIHNKNSIVLANAWINQMAPTDFNSFKRMHNKLGMNLPMPGKELPSQNSSESIKSTLKLIPRMIENGIDAFQRWRKKNNLVISSLKKK